MLIIWYEWTKSGKKHAFTIIDIMFRFFSSFLLPFPQRFEILISCNSTFFFPTQHSHHHHIEMFLSHFPSKIYIADFDFLLVFQGFLYTLRLGWKRIKAFRFSFSSSRNGTEFCFINTEKCWIQLFKSTTATTQFKSHFRIMYSFSFSSLLSHSVETREFAT